MLRRKILIICYNVTPDNSAQAQQLTPLIHALSEFCDIKLVSGQFLGEANLANAKVFKDAYKLEETKTLISRKIPLLHSALLRLLPFYGKLPDHLGHLTKRITSNIARDVLPSFYPDVIISFGHPMSDHLIGHALARDYAIPLITHFSDPWANNPYFKNLFPLTDSLFNNRFEKLVTSHAAAVIFTNRFGLEHFLKYREDSLKKKCFVVPHSIPKVTDDGLNLIGVADQFIIRHVGSLYGLRNADALLSSMLLLEKHFPNVINQIELEFVGYLSRSVQSKIRNYSGKIKIKMVGQVSSEEAAELMRKSSLLVSIDADITPNIFLPSKVFDYLGNNNCVLAISPDGATSDFANTVGFPCFDPKQLRSIANEINSVIEGKSIFPKNLHKYTARENAIKLTEIVEKLF